MPKAVMLVFTHPADPAREDEYNEWFETKHLAEVCSAPGVISARRFRVSADQHPDFPPSGPLPQYVVIYELEADDISGALHGIGDYAEPAPKGLIASDQTGVYEWTASHPADES